MDMTPYLSGLLALRQPIKCIVNKGLWGEVDSMEDLKCY
jgi:hypothetical protein